MNHPDMHRYIHAARAADRYARARAREMSQAAAVIDPGRSGMLVRTRLGWFLIEAGLRLLRPSAPPSPAEN